MKKNYLIIAFLFSSIMFGQTTFNVANGNWSTAANWSGGSVPTVATTLAVLTANVNLDGNQSLGGFLRSQTNTVSGTGTLTSAGTSADGLLSNGTNFIFNSNLVMNCTNVNTIKSLQVNNAVNLGNRQLTLGSSSVLTLTTPAAVITGVNSKVVFQGKIQGAAALNFGSGSSNGVAEFDTASDNTSFNGEMVFAANASTVIANTAGTGYFLKSGSKVQVNATGCSLTLNGANSCNGNVSLSTATNFTLNINANQGSFGTITVGNSPLTINVAAAVTNLSFANSASLSWGTGTVAITGYQSGEIRFGTANTALTAAQLSRITADGAATGLPLMLDANGYLVVDSFSTFNNTSGNSLWSNAGNWAALRLPTQNVQLNANVNLDNNFSITGMVRNGNNTLSGTGTLTSAGTVSDGVALLSNGTNFTFNGNLVINNTFISKSLQVNNTVGTGVNRQLTLGSSSVVTLTTAASVVTEVNAKVVFQGRILGAAALNFSGAAEFDTASDNRNFTGEMVFTGASSTVIANTTGTGYFLSSGRQVLVNATSCSLTLNGADSCNGNINVASTHAFALNINANQGSLGTVTVTNGPITINVALAVTTLSFANSAAIGWGTGTVAITGYESGEIRFGTTSAALTATQLSRISADGVAAGRALTLDSNGYLVVAPTTWTGGTSTSWTVAANWSNGVPVSTSVVTIGTGTFQPSITSNVSINTLTISSGASLIVSSGNLTITGAVINNGALTIANNTNLIQVNNVANSGSGTTNVNRNGSTLKRLDYTLWSSPVASQNLLNFSPLTVTPRFYTYNEGSDKFSVVVSPSGTTFTPGRSFFIRMPDVYPLGSGNQTPYYLGQPAGTLAYPGVFTGTLNNGNVSVTLTKALNGYQAVGNPYPSVIDAQSFVTANTANIENTLYFWRKTNLASGSSYATWTSGGATSVTPTSGTPNGKIQVGQGFIVKAKNAGTVATFFTNAMRDAAPASTQFFKTKQGQKDRLWLNLTSSTGAFSQALVAYIDDANVGLDQYDGKYINDSDIALTTSIAGDEYTIQGRPAFNAIDVVSLNFKTSVAGTYTIAIDHVDGLFSKGQDIYLVDKTTGVATNLNEGAYTFTAAVGVDNTRFTLAYQKTLKVDAPLFNENSVLVSRNNGTVNVKSSSVAINNIKVYDVQGRLVAERKNVKSNTASFSNLKANQVLIVKVTAENSAVVTKKVLN